MRRKVFILIGLVVLLAVVIFSVVYATTTNAANQVMRQFDLGNKYLSEGKYEEAILAFEKVVKIDPKNVEARIGLARAYVKTNRVEDAIPVLKDAVALSPEKPEPYLELAKIYLAKNDYKSAMDILEEGMKQSGDDGIQALIDEIKPKAPQVSVQSGSYTEIQKIEFTDVSEKDEVFYTLDGSTPDISSKKYEGPIELAEGSHVLRAIAFRAKAIASPESKYEYQITIPVVKPNAPQATLQSGTYDSDKTVELKSAKGEKIFYSVDGKAPGINSNQYTTTINIKEGKTVLKAVAVSEGGILSDVAVFTYEVKKQIVAESVQEDPKPETPKPETPKQDKIIEVKTGVTVIISDKNTLKSIQEIAPNTIACISVTVDKGKLPDSIKEKTVGMYLFGVSDWEITQELIDNELKQRIASGYNFGNFSKKTIGCENGESCDFCVVFLNSKNEIVGIYNHDPVEVKK